MFYKAGLDEAFEHYLWTGELELEPSIFNCSKFSFHHTPRGEVSEKLVLDFTLDRIKARSCFGPTDSRVLV